MKRSYRERGVPSASMRALGITWPEVHEFEKWWEMNDLWTGDFGNDYTRRQANTIDARAKMWHAVLPQWGAASPGSILEVGANAGDNLWAVSNIRHASLYATEPNELAFEKLVDAELCIQVTDDVAKKLSFADNSMDLVFTSGVLIHVPPADLAASLSEIHRVAKRYIIAAEYFAPSEEMIPYRGHDNALWRRDYGSLYLDQFPDLRCISCTFAWKRTTGLDNLTIWVFEKEQRQ